MPSPRQNRLISPFLFASVLSVIAVPALAAYDPPPLKPGAPLPWHGGVQVSTYSNVNTFNGNMFTAIPVVSWSGRGPDMNFALFHNSASWNHTPTDTKNVGFFLGSGWTTSYSDRLILTTTPRTVIRADGTKFTIGQAGFHDVLVQDNSSPPKWQLKHKDQSYHEFEEFPDGEVRLTRVVDASNNATVIEYEEYEFNAEDYFRMKKITASDRELNLVYESISAAPGTRLIRIESPGATDLPVDGIDSADRAWEFIYDTDDDDQTWFRSLEDPLENRIDLTYAETCIEYDQSPESNCIAWKYQGRLASVSDAYNISFTGYSTPKSYAHTYYGSGTALGKARYTCDLDCTASCGPGTTCVNQRFTYSAVSPGYVTTKYYDRRGSEWQFKFNKSGENLWPDGNLNTTIDPGSATTSISYDSERNPDYIEYPDLSWVFLEFDSNGNLLEIEDALSHVRSWTYSSSNNNLLTSTDPLGNVTRYCYGLSEFPTLLTKIIEPDSAMNPVSPSSCSATGYPTTTMDYYTTYAQLNSSDPDSFWEIPGQLKEVIDPNGVWTGFEYDLWGQLGLYTEGKWESQVATTFLGDQCGPVEDSTGCSRQGGSNAGACNERECDGNGNNTSQEPSTACDFGPGAFSSPPPFVPAGFPIRPCEAPPLPKLINKFENAVYSPKSELLELPLEIVPDADEEDFLARNFENQFDALGQLTQTTVSSQEFDGANFVDREFIHEPDQAAGNYLRTGPDGIETYVEFDAAGQPFCMRRGPQPGTGDGPIMEAEFNIFGGLLYGIEYGNGSTVEYIYDEARRVTDIVYRNGNGSPVFSLEYTYTADDLPETITETIGVAFSATTTYTYDARRRLTYEERDGWDSSDSYELEYQYDDGGNRTVKIDHLNEVRTEYHYDTEGDNEDSWGPADYKSHYNRLQYYEVYDTSQQSQTLESTSWYLYSDDDGTTWGNPKRIVTEYESDPDVYHSVRFGYARDNRTVSYVLGENWEWDGESECEETDSYEILWAREFRYDSGRARYLSRELDPGDLENGTITPVSQLWTDYDGDTSYGDYSIASGSPPTVTDIASYEPGMALVEEWVDEGGDSTVYQVTDHLGTVRGHLDTSSEFGIAAVYTAFGERIGMNNPRYGYIGAHGYQSHSISEATDPDKAFPFLHVGARYYDPATGRFLQRDPIGVDGGLNVYGYASNLPTWLVDPSGLGPVGEFIGEFIGAGLGGIGGAALITIITKNPLAGVGAAGSGGVAGAKLGGIVGDWLGDLLSESIVHPPGDETSLDIPVSLPTRCGPIHPIPSPGPVFERPWWEKIDNKGQKKCD